MTPPDQGVGRGAAYDPDCRRCPRLARFLEATRGKHPDYFARPVPSFGARAPRLLIVGLAPGMHGANRSGRPFTGDFAGILLYRTLHDLGLAVESDGDRRMPSKTPDPDTGMVFQELIVAPFSTGTRTA